MSDIQTSDAAARLHLCGQAALQAGDLIGSLRDLIEAEADGTDGYAGMMVLLEKINDTVGLVHAGTDAKHEKPYADMGLIKHFVRFEPME